MNDFEKIEHLLLNKRFEELSPTEVKEVTSYFENATDYNDMRDTLMQVKSTLAADKLLIKPNVELKEKLLQKFDNTYTNQSSAALGKKRPFYKSVGFQWSAAASIVIIISLSIFGYIQNIGNKTNDGLAQNYETPAAKDHTNVMPDDVTTEDGTLTGKEKVTTVGPGLGSTTVSDNEANAPTTVGGINVMPNEMGEGDMNNRSNENKNVFGTFGTVKTDNTILPVISKNGFETETKEEKVNNNADFYFNDAINTKTEDKKDDLLKLKANDERNDDKNIEPNKGSEVQTQSIFNYSVNKNETTTDKNAYKKNKNKLDNKNMGKVSLGLAQEKYVEDSAKVALDSLKVDPNIDLAPKIDLDKNHK